MPEMDGFEFLETLRGDVAFSNIPVIGMTATDLSEADRRRLNSGIVEFVSKAACDRDELLARIRDFVARNVSIDGMQQRAERDG
jgi:CheY-like chemotaxis protein